MPLVIQILLVIAGFIAFCMGLWLIYDGIKLGREMIRERKEKAMGVCRTGAEFNHKVDKDGLDIYQRVEMLEREKKALYKRVSYLESCHDRDIRMIHDYLKVQYSYVPAERKLVKKKASK